MRQSRKSQEQARRERRHAILAALARTSSEMNLSYHSAERLDGEPEAYYTLARDELEALLAGDMAKVESWVSNLDRPHATWLLRWLIKESG